MKEVEVIKPKKNKFNRASGKELVINEKEAEVVRFIFDFYNQGKGSRLIRNELKEKGYKSKRGSNNWPDSTIRGILKNEKYMGNLLLGKTFTVDPITNALTIWGKKKSITSKITMSQSSVKKSLKKPKLLETNVIATWKKDSHQLTFVFKTGPKATITMGKEPYSQLLPDTCGDSSKAIQKR